MKKLKIFLFIILTLSGSSALMAQQEALYTQYMFNTLAINPAYAGSRNVASATALYRNQWVGIPGAPKTATLTVDGPINNKKIGLGLQLFNDNIGITKTNGIIASYAYRIQMDRGTLAFGLQAGINQFRADFTTVDLGSDQSPDVAFNTDINKILGNFGAGVYYNTDKFYVGFSAPQLLRNKITNFTVDNDVAFSGRETHLFLAAGYVFPLGEDFHLKPSILIKEVRGAPIQADVNATFWIKDVLGIGVQYRTEAAVAALLEVQVSPQFRIGYSYDYSTNKLVDFNSGSHEIMIRYEFGFPKGKILSPRYF